jgi:uncharacterized protein (TIRG00374 family)
LIDKVKKNLLISLIIAAVIYLALSVYADFDSVINAFAEFGLLLIPVLLALSYLNYYTRFLKWHYYLNILDIKASWKDSYLIFMSGLVMSVTPGKVGELLKSYMLKKNYSEPISKTAPIVLAERLTDFISLLILGLAGAYFFDYGQIIVIITSVCFVLFILLISNKSSTQFTLRFLSKIKFLKKYIQKFETAYNSIYILLRPRPFAYMIALSFVSWFFECLGFYLILENFNLNFSLFWASFTYAFSTIIGSITMLPGGLGVTDGSITYLLLLGNVQESIAVAATFIVRAVTLWFAVLVGIVSLVYYKNRFGIIENDTQGFQEEK